MRAVSPDALRSKNVGSDANWTENVIGAIASPMDAPTGQLAARTWIADDVHGAGGVRIVLRLAVADLDVARPADVAGAVVPEQPRRHAGRAIGREADRRAAARAVGRDEVLAARLGAAGS